MPSEGITSIRTESAKLNISKGGSTAIYVDQSSSKASDKHDGFDWDRPKKTLQGAIDILEPWTEIYIRSGVYQENIEIEYENITMHGLVQAGSDRVEISPVSGVPLKVTAGYSNIRGISVVSSDANAIELTGPGHKLHDCYIECNNFAGPQISAILLNDADKTSIRDCHLNGKLGLNTIGVRVDGTLNASVDNVIEANYFEKFGTIGVAGQGINLNNAQRCLILKNIFSSCYNGVYCELNSTALHTVIGNQFYENAGLDIVDLNDEDDRSIHIANNYYGYAGWYDDPNHDGVASVAVSCYNNWDYAPLAYPHYQGPSFLPREAH